MLPHRLGAVLAGHPSLAGVPAQHTPAQPSPHHLPPRDPRSRHDAPEGASGHSPARLGNQQPQPQQPQEGGGAAPEGGGEACPLLLTALPTHVLLQLLGRLDRFSLAVLSQTCRALHRLCGSPELWPGRRLGGPLVRSVRLSLAALLRVPPQMVSMRLEEGRSSKFPLAAYLHNLRFVLGAGDVEGLAERASGALQERIARVPLAAEYRPASAAAAAGGLPLCAALELCRADRGAVRVGLRPGVALARTLRAAQRATALPRTLPPPQLCARGGADGAAGREGSGGGGQEPWGEGLLVPAAAAAHCAALLASLNGGGDGAAAAAAATEARAEAAALQLVQQAAVGEPRALAEWHSFADACRSAAAQRAAAAAARHAGGGSAAAHAAAPPAPLPHCPSLQPAPGAAAGVTPHLAAGALFGTASVGAALREEGAAAMRLRLLGLVWQPRPPATAATHAPPPPPPSAPPALSAAARAELEAALSATRAVTDAYGRLVTLVGAIQDEVAAALAAAGGACGLAAATCDWGAAAAAAAAGDRAGGCCCLLDVCCAATSGEANMGLVTLEAMLEVRAALAAAATAAAAAAAAAHAAAPDASTSAAATLPPPPPPHLEAPPAGATQALGRRVGAALPHWEVAYAPPAVSAGHGGDNSGGVGGEAGATAAGPAAPTLATALRDVHALLCGKLVPTALRLVALQPGGRVSPLGVEVAGTGGADASRRMGAALARALVSLDAMDAAEQRGALRALLLSYLLRTCTWALWCLAAL